jgi:hypothetical protein
MAQDADIQILVHTRDLFKEQVNRPAARHPPASSEAPQPLVRVMGLTGIPRALHVGYRRSSAVAR